MTRRRSPPRHRTAARPAKGAGRLRLIGGEYRRRLLPVLDRPGLRPTPDRVRETLFNWLASATPGARALDLFAGSGALGLEALSRGAAAVRFVERDPGVAAQLTANLALLGATPRGQVSTVDALDFLDGTPAPHDLVFIDPPFHQGLVAPCCAALEQGWLTAEAWVYVEMESAVEPSVPSGWALHRETRAGDTTARLYRRSARPDPDAC